MDPVVAGLGVEVADLEVAAGADGREHRAEVVVEVVGRGDRQLAAGSGLDPGREGQPRRRGPRAPVAARQMTGASIARRAQSRAGSSPSAAGGRVTGGQVPRTDRSRAEAQRVSAPAWRRELANSAISGGPSACTAAQREGMSVASPASRQTCRLALLHIICAPPGPIGT